MNKKIFFCFCLFTAAPAFAIELSLEENRAERGSVGYVDMQRLFASSPDSLHAKEGFQDLVRQAEERIDLRKAELLKIRREQEALRLERDAINQSTPASSTSTLVSLSTTPLVAVSSAGARTLALPGMTPMEAAPIATTTGTVIAVSSPTLAAPPSLAQRLLEIDGKLIALQADIARKENELAHEHEDADHGLLDAESRRTDQVLARMYRAITRVAKREGVSVVVDKSTLLYGHSAVDLTDKVLKQLREAPQP